MAGRTVVDGFREEEQTFERSVENRRKSGAPEFVFYDGPPFANGLPHYGHIVTGFVKDLVPRYQTMRGKQVERRFGWDCHGLPAELHSETELKVSGRRDILKYGMARFNEHCRTSVMQFRGEWEYYVNRSARWVDFDNDYRTMDLSYMESVMWAFKRLWDKGLVYEGYRVVPYSWAAQTPLSNFETRLDNATRPRQDPALTVGFQLHPRAGEAAAPKLLAWTTTPWTLPSNLALAVHPVDFEGNFTSEVPPYQGKNVFEANKDIIRDLKAVGKVVRHETYEHNYPHCWRTDQPLIYKAIPSWYVKVTAFRDDMVRLNQGITWVPAHIRDGIFGNWLENAHDWNIGRNRYWGSPIPVWKSDNPEFPRIDVYGSLDEIERDFGVRPKDLHRPYVDELVRPNPDDPSGNSMMRRVEDVVDCWFESGSMPFAQVHYPFENKDWFEGHFPGDFIVEYVGQTRGWFYTLVVLAAALFDKAPFRNCVCHGIVLDENKQKLSKRLKNYPDPVAVFDNYGADALRWY